jgi:hypothetical protein
LHLIDQRVAHHIGGQFELVPVDHFFRARLRLEGAERQRMHEHPQGSRRIQSPQFSCFR